MVRATILWFKRNKLKKELNDESLKDFKHIVEYIGMSSLSLIEREIVFQQVLDMMLHAKSEGKFASEAIGNDMKGFCDSIIEESNFNKSVLHIYFNYAEKILQMVLIVFLVISILDLIFSGGSSSLKNQFGFNMDRIIYCVAIALISPLYFVLIRKNIFEKKRNIKIYFGVVWTICSFLSFRMADAINAKFPRLASTHIITHGNKLFLLIIFSLIIFSIAFGRDICYLVIKCHPSGKSDKLCSLVTVHAPAWTFCHLPCGWHHL